MSCPAMRAYFEDTFVVASAFSLKLRRVSNSTGFTVCPVYPFTSIPPKRVQKFINVQPRSTWRKPDRVVLQISTPYMFFADEPVEIEQMHPILGDIETLNWNLIPGRFDIYAWQRTLNCSMEWDCTLGDLTIRQGDPLFFVRFRSENGQRFSVSECAFTGDIKERFRLFRGIASVRRGNFGLFEDAASARAHIKLVQDPAQS